MQLQATTFLEICCPLTRSAICCRWHMNSLTGTYCRSGGREAKTEPAGEDRVQEKDRQQLGTESGRGKQVSHHRDVHAISCCNKVNYRCSKATDVPVALTVFYNWNRQSNPGCCISFCCSSSKASGMNSALLCLSHLLCFWLHTLSIVLQKSKLPAPGRTGCQALADGS